MKRRSALDQFEQDILDESVSIQKLLRLVIVLGGRAVSAPLRNWVMHELRGYSGASGEVPSYRVVPAPLHVDSRSSFWQARGEMVSVLDLPDVAQDVISENLPITFSVGQLQSLLAKQAPDEPLKLAVPGSAELARMMTYERGERGVIVERVYWSVHPSALHDVLEQARNNLLHFVAELRAAIPPGELEPTVGHVHQAVQNIHITVGDHSPVSLTAPLSLARRDSLVKVPSVSRSRWRFTS